MSFADITLFDSRRSFEIPDGILDKISVNISLVSRVDFSNAALIALSKFKNG
jgi:hypothetical protein